MIYFRRLGKQGRLGNQLFQIAVTVAMAKKHNDVAMFLKWPYMEYFINPINQTLDFTDIDYEYKEPCKNYVEIPYIHNMNLRGYFQSEKYFAHCIPDIRYHFTFDTSKMVSGIEIGPYTCSVHVRRGDYVRNPMRNMCSINYYSAAMQFIRTQTRIDTFVVFSDDIRWCRQNLTGSDVVYIKGNKDIEDLFLMSKCSHHIIANSSFSWWGSWLNTNPDKIIIAPNKWYFDTRDIYTDNMIKINV